MRFAFFLLILLVGLPALAQETRIAAVVNADIVTDGDLLARLKLIELSSNIPDTPENRQRLAPQILRSLIDEKLQMQDLKKLGSSVPK
jgi:peptidyl-prolyl cis-trans isomerase SurA